MQEQLISFETAKLAKEKGFNIECHSHYFEDGEFRENEIIDSTGFYGGEYYVSLSQFNENWNNKWLTSKNGNRCFGCENSKKYFNTFSAPTQALLQKWLREKHDIQINVNSCHHYRGELIGYMCKITKNNTQLIKEVVEFPVKTNGFNQNNTYEEALGIGLQEALKLI